MIIVTQVTWPSQTERCSQSQSHCLANTAFGPLAMQSRPPSCRPLAFLGAFVSSQWVFCSGWTSSVSADCSFSSDSDCLRTYWKIAGAPSFLFTGVVCCSFFLGGGGQVRRGWFFICYVLGIFYGVHFLILVFMMEIIPGAKPFLHDSNNQYYTTTEELFSRSPVSYFGQLSERVGSLGLRDRAPLGRRRAADRSCERGAPAGSSFVAAGLVFQAGMAFGAEGGVTPVSVGTMRMRFYDALFYYCFVFAVVRVYSSLFLESCISWLLTCWCLSASLTTGRR